MKTRKNHKAVLAAIILLMAAVAGAGAQERVTEIVIHGNYKTPEAEILSLSGLSVGAELTDAALLQAKKRLEESGRFATVEILKRYRSLTTDGPVVLLILVKERESTFDKFLYAPIIGYTDEDGFTAGVKVSTIDLLGLNERIFAPLSFGGVEQAGATVRFENLNEAIGQLEIGVLRHKWRNPHYDVEDERLSTRVDAIQRFGYVRVSAGWLYEGVTFGAIEDTVQHLNAQVAFDSRRSIFDPYDAVYAAAGYERIWSDAAAEPIDRYTVDLRAYLRVVGRTVLAGWLRTEKSSAPLPAFLRPVMGGAQTLRGYETDLFSGDNILLGTLELRLPLTEVTSVYTAGLTAFYDTGVVWDDTTRFDDAVRHEGAGFGGYFLLSGIGFSVSLANELEGHWRAHFGSGFKF